MAFSSKPRFGNSRKSPSGGRPNNRSRRSADDENETPETPAPNAPRSGKVTDIKHQRHDPNRVSVFLDDVFAFGLSTDLLVELGLYVGVELLETQTEDMLAADEIKRATAAALQLLSFRARSEGEITTRLRQREFGAAAIEGAIVRLREWHYVDDADFATRWVENRQQHRPRSTRMLAHELRGKGVAPETIEETLAVAGVDEVGDARELVVRQRIKYASLEPDVQTRRISGFLARRGYAYDVIRRAMEQDEDRDVDGDRPGDDSG